MTDYYCKLYPKSNELIELVRKMKSATNEEIIKTFHQSENMCVVKTVDGYYWHNNVLKTKSKKFRDSVPPDDEKFPGCILMIDDTKSPDKYWKYLEQYLLDPNLICEDYIINPDIDIVWFLNALDTYGYNKTNINDMLYADYGSAISLIRNVDPKWINLEKLKIYEILFYIIQQYAKIEANSVLDIYHAFPDDIHPTFMKLMISSSLYKEKFGDDE
jgi:hypothetical protein